MSTRAIVIEAPRHLHVQPREPRSPGPGEALVRVAYSGICGSDREIYTGGRPKELVRYPITPGHEWSGTVVAVAADVDESLIGQLVVGEGFRNCGTCTACRRGENNLCAGDYDETGFTQPGAWADHLTLPARLLHLLPPGTDLRAAAALEPAACTAAASLALHTLPGERLAVVGGGSLGLLATQLLAATSPGELVLVDPHRDRAELATACGAGTLLTPSEAESRTGEFDAALEAAGHRGTAELATRLVRPGGRVTLTGVPADEDHPLFPDRLVCSQITLHTVFGAPSRAWSHAVRAFTSGVLDPLLIVSHELDLDHAERALDMLGDHRSPTVKILLRP